MADKDTGIVSIHGKQYKTVALRISEFRETHPTYGIITKLVSADDEAVVVKATIIAEGHERFPLATGYAEERRSASQINKTSALENAETSAVGRALAFLGYAGSEIASADEVANAIGQQNAEQAVQRHIDHANALKANWESVVAIKTFIGIGELPQAVEAWGEVSNEDKQSLWLAPTKGGVFTTDERKTMKSNEWAAARKEMTE